MSRTTAGTRTAAPTTVSLSNCLNFNGTSNYVSIADNAAYSYATNSGLTVSAWLNPFSLAQLVSEQTGYINIIDKVLPNTQNEWEMRMYTTGNSESRNNRMSFYMFALTNGTGDGADVEDKVVAGEWVHLVGTVDGNKTVRLYKNGLLRDSITSSLVFADGTQAIQMGKSESTVPSYWQGKIDGFNIWNRVLTDPEIQDLYNKNTIPTSGLVAKFMFDEGSGTTITDSSSTANDGTITGATYQTSLSRTRRPVNTLPPTQLNQIGTTQVDTTPNILCQKKEVRSMSSLALDGSTQYASVANGTQTGITPATYDFMVGGWFLIHHTAAVQVLLDKHSGTGYATNNATNIGFDLVYRGETASFPLQFRLTDGTNSTTRTLNNTKVMVADGNWHHIVAYYDRTNTVTSIMVDGVKHAEATPSNAMATLTNTGDFMVGTRVDHTVGFLNGNVSDAFFYVFPNSLPTNFRQIIDDIYKLGKYSTTGLVSRWTFNSVATDSVGGNTLTLAGSPSYSTTAAPIISRTAI